MTSTEGPLAGIKVVDLCIARAGPTCVRVLADFGAEVIQIVRPQVADIDNSLPDFDRENLHRNKRSIVLNLQTEAGREVFYRLVKDADVVVENFRADVKHRLKIDYETLRALNPRIVYGSISGFGQDGPYAARPGVDQIAQGLGGVMSVTGPPGSGPWRVGVPISDLCSGMYLAHGIMAALLEREHSGEGQWVQTSLLEAMVAMLDFQATRWLIGGEVPPQAGNDHPTGFPMGTFEAEDGLVNIAASGDRMFRSFLGIIKAEELAEDERFATPRARNGHREELRTLVNEKLKNHTCAELIEALNAVGVPCGPVLSIDQVFEDVQVRHLVLAGQVKSPHYGPLTLVRSPVRFSRSFSGLKAASPRPGGNTLEVLEELGYTPDAIAQLRDEGAIGDSG
jgi:crotonobetainyl-CoA:carnitine CoA-transferase CaiB-like acyl-CoA transferase